MYFADLPCGQEDDRWHQLLQNNAKTPRGSLRLGALFKDLVILPVDEYAGLKEVGAVLSGGDQGGSRETWFGEAAILW